RLPLSRVFPRRITRIVLPRVRRPSRPLHRFRLGGESTQTSRHQLRLRRATRRHARRQPPPTGWALTALCRSAAGLSPCPTPRTPRTCCATPRRDTGRGRARRGSPTPTTPWSPDPDRGCPPRAAAHLPPGPTAHAWAARPRRPTPPTHRDSDGRPPRTAPAPPRAPPPCSTTPPGPAARWRRCPTASRSRNAPPATARRALARTRTRSPRPAHWCPNRPLPPPREHPVAPVRPAPPPTAVAASGPDRRPWNRATTETTRHAPTRPRPRARARCRRPSVAPCPPERRPAWSPTLTTPDTAPDSPRRPAPTPVWSPRSRSARRSSPATPPAGCAAGPTPTTTGSPAAVPVPPPHRRPTTRPAVPPPNRRNRPAPHPAPPPSTTPPSQSLLSPLRCPARPPRAEHQPEHRHHHDHGTGDDVVDRRGALLTAAVPQRERR